MAEYTHNIYGGNNFGLSENYGKPIGRIPFAQMGQAVNAQTANQLKAVSDALNTGAKNVEVQLTFPQIEKAITNEHLEELNRLRKLTGANLTLHGPMVEPTGVNMESNRWTEQDRIQAERRMSFAVQRGKKIDPDGNLIVTLHASTQLPEIETKIKEEDGTEVVTHIGAVNTQSGAVGMLQVTDKDFFEGKNKPEDYINNMNEENWFKQLQGLGFHVHQGTETVKRALIPRGELPKEVQSMLKGDELQKAYADFLEGKLDKKIEGFSEQAKQLIMAKMSDITHGDLYLRDAYNDFKSRFNDAYETAMKDGNFKDLAMLEKFKQKVKDNIELMQNPSEVGEFGEFLVSGVNMLRKVKAPRTVKSIKEFALDKASETFSNVAFDAYKKFGDTAPIISLENHPAGQSSGFNRADQLKLLIDATRKRFVDKAVDEGLSKHEAEKQAEKLIGVTWDVGHINNLRKFGYTDEDLAEQTKIIAPYVKHVHLADNFGLEDAEMAMGQGNVPMKKHEEMLKRYGKLKPEEITRIVEAYDTVSQFQGASPLPQVVSHYGSPIYAMEMAPFWNQYEGTIGAYSSGYGEILPNVSWRAYGASFTGLPTELGGVMGGGRSGLTGTPMT